VPALALALGVWSNSGRLFEMLYFPIWFLGVFSGGRVWPFDFLGRGNQPAAVNVPTLYVVTTAILLALAFIGRRKQLYVSLR